MLLRAGRVMRMPITATKTTALAGILVLVLTVDQYQASRGWRRRG